MGLNHLHQHGPIHQDVEAGSILVDGNGRVQLVDFSVSTCMLDTGDQQQSRSTSLGSCCWMAPEMIERVHGYDSNALQQAADTCGLEPVAYEFYSDAFLLYEEEIVDSKA